MARAAWQAVALVYIGFRFPDQIIAFAKMRDFSG
jgi:hypothetical protein